MCMCVCTEQAAAVATHCLIKRETSAQRFEEMNSKSTLEIIFNEQSGLKMITRSDSDQFLLSFVCLINVFTGTNVG